MNREKLDPVSLIAFASKNSAGRGVLLALALGQGHQGDGLGLGAGRRAPIVASIWLGATPGQKLLTICNCCPCCCPTMRGIVEFNRLTAVAHADFQATVNDTACDGCGDCIEYCHFGALSLPQGLCVVNTECCMGCGLCAAACLLDALSLVRRPQGQTPAPPADLDEWTAEYARGRGISLV